MRVHARAIATKAVYVLLALIIVTGGYFAKPAGPAQAAAADSKLLQFTSAGHVLGFGVRAIYLAGLDHALRVELAGGRSVQPVAEGAAGTGGGKPFSKVSYSGAWKNIDAVFSAVDGGIAESTYAIHPGGNPADISLRYNVPVEIMPEGGLRLYFTNGYMTESAPVAWQEINGERLPVSVEFQRQQGDRVGFSTGSYDEGSTLFIDPLYQWHTFYGSATGDEQGAAIALDSSGNIYVAGKSIKTWNGPSGQSPLHAHGGGTVNRNLFVLKLNSAGAYQWHTFYGGSSGQGDDGNCIALDASNNVYVGGSSYLTWNGPSGQAPLHAHATAAGGFDILVLKLNSAGAYQWHTYYGNNTPSYQDGAQAIALDSSNNVYVAGASLYTWGSPLNPHSGGGTNGYDIVVMKLNSAGAYQWHTFYGGGPVIMDIAYGIALDSSANIYVAGYSMVTWNGPSGQPPLHAHDGTANKADIVVMKLNSAGAYQWHTFYGGAGYDMAYGLGMDSSANIYVAGYSDATWTGSSGQAPLNAFEGTANIPVLKLNSAGAYQWHTFYGGTFYNVGYAIAANPAGTAVYVTGTSRGNWNGPGPTPPTNPFIGGADLLIMELNGSGDYQYHTFYGSTNYSEEGHGVTINSSGVVYVAGYTQNWSTCAGQAPLNPYTGRNDILVIAPRSSSPPRVLTDNATVAGTFATLNGNVTAINGTSITERGFVWDTTSYVMPCAVPPASYANYWTQSGSYGTGAFTHLLSGLAPNTTFYYRAYAKNNTDDYAYGVELPFVTLAEPPTVSTAAADSLTYHSARLNGSLTALGTATPATLSFEYGLNDSYGSTVAGVPSTAGSVPAAFTATLDPLPSGTIYHFRAKAVTTDGTAYGSDQTFTTYTSPSVSASAATDVTNLSATLNGNLTSLGSAASVNVSFDYGTSSGSYTVHTTPVSRSATGAFTAPISSLSHSTTYYWRAVADGGATYGTSYSTPEHSFTTRTPPTVATDIATGISGGNVTLNGALTSMGTATGVDVRFGYGTDHSYASKTTAQARATQGAYNQALSLANGTYYYRAEADGGIHGPSYGAEKTFTIGGGSSSPSATTQPATAIGGSSATLNGNITNMGSAGSVNWSFQYGTVSGYYPNETAATAKTAAGPVSFTQAGLLSSTTYYYRVKIEAGTAGGALGAEKSFTTGLTCPTANTDIATGIGTNGTTLNGNLLSLGTAASVNVSFQYGTSPGIYPSVTADVAKDAPGTFNSALTGLAAGTTYYYRARVDDGTSGGVFGTEKSFLTGSTCPTATTQTATGITASGATLQGNLVSTGSALTVNTYLQWGTVSGVYANEATAQVLTAAAPFYAAIGSLTNGVSYYYRAKVDGGSAGGSFGAEKSFTAGRTCPTVNTDTPTSVTADGATLNANLLTMGTAGSVNVSFQYGIASGSYPLETPQLGKGAPGTFNAPLSGLAASTTYYYRAKVDDGASGGVFGAEKSFTTGLTCPTASTQTATDIGSASATLQGNLLSLGTAPSVGVTFQWGTSTGVYASETPPQALSTLVPFTAGLTGLGPNTTYYYRAKADGGLHGSVFGIEKSFTTGLTCPTANTDTPTLITADGATLNGNLLSLGTAAPPVKVSFQWGSAPGVYPFETTQEDKAAAGTFNSALSGLAGSTTYYYRAKVDDGTSGGMFGAEKAFRTGSTCPTATTELVNPISATTATLHGNLAAKGTAGTVNVTFQWGSLPGVYINETAQQPLISPIPFTANLIGLTYGNTYYYRAKADGGIYGSMFGSEMTFSTDSTPPTIFTDTPTAITPTGATVNGVLTTMGSANPTDASFKWGIASGSYPNETTPPQSMGAPGTFDEGLSGLTTGATYYYRAKAVRDPHGGAFGDQLSFLTGSACPTATTQTATSITPTTATLNGNLLTMGTATSINACFQWGTASGVYANQTPVHSVTWPQPFTAGLTGLTNGVTYYYRAKADGGVYGSVFGVEKSFIAGSTPLTIITDTPTDITVSSARVNGVLTSLGGVPNALVSFQYGTDSGVYPFETTQQTISAAGTFNFNITSLSATTTYYYRAKVDDGTNGGAFGDQLSFLTGSACPTATTQTATSITPTTATLNGNLLTMGTATSINACFQWGTASGVYANQTPVHSVTWPQPFTAGLSGLTNGVTYYYRAKADGGVYGSVFGVEKSFTAGSNCPTIITDTPTDIAATTAQLNGILTLPGTATYPVLVSFQWGSSAGVYPDETPQQPYSAAGAFNSVINGLTSGSTYYYRAKVDDGTSGGAFGVERHFIAGSTCPTGATQTATDITAATATLNGNLLTLGSATTVDVMFQWGTASTVYANETTPLNVPSERPFTFGLTGLAGGTTYFYRAKIDGGVYGSVFGAEKSFTAGSTPLTILTDTPTNIAPASATLNGILTSLGGVPDALVSFQWGSASGVYPFETMQRTRSTGGTFTDNITGLTSGSLYYYRAKVDDGTSGGAFGVERSFRAGATCPTGATQTATDITAATATLNGNLLTLGSATPTVDVMFQWGTAPTHYVNETTPQPMSSGAPFAAGLSSLVNGTTYYYRAKIDGGVNGSVIGAEKSFTAGRTNPSVTTDGVTTITPSGGTLNGILMSLGTADNASVTFQWGTATGVYPFETVPQLQTSPIAFTATLTGLTDNVIYYYRAKVDDGVSGGHFGLERTFRAGATCPNATTQTATGITATSAILQGNLLTKGSASVVDACFQWGTTTGGYVNQTPLQAMNSGAPFLATLTGLVDGTTYYYRARVDGGSNGICLGVEKSFIAGHNPPVVLTDTPTSIAPSSVTLNGIMTTLGMAPNALVSFQWGTTTGVYPDETPQQDYGAAGTFSNNLTGLTNGATYYYRAKADDGVSGGAFGDERSFRAGTTCPTASTEPATEVAVDAALLHANLTSLGSAPSCNITFEWGTVSTVYPNETAPISRTAPGIVSYNLTGLAADTQYFLRAKADGGLNGSALGLEKNFFTGRTPPTVTTDPAYVTTTTATLRGNLTSLGSAPSCNITFEWGRTPGIYLFETSIQVKEATGAYQAGIDGLSPNTTYYFRGKADGGTHGGAFSAERTLLTAGATSTVTGGEKGPVTFSTSAGNLSGLTAAAASSLPCNFGMVKFPFGVFAFTITNLTPGGTAVVLLGLPESIADSAMYYKCQNGSLIDCTSLLGHNNGDNTLTLSLTDGGLGDADGLRNGVIVDPGGPVLRDLTTGGSRQGSSPSISASPPSQMPANTNEITPQSMVDRVNPVTMALPNIVVISAELERHEAVSGEPVKVTAMVTNKGATDGTARVMVTVNGYEAATQGVNVAKGGTVPVEFYVSGDSPGQYQVYVNNVSAGEFNVSDFKQSDLILWMSTVCVLAALTLGIVYTIRRRRDEY